MPTRSPNRAVDVLAAGELLVDLIGDAAERGLEEVRRLEIQQGGSAANLAVNCGRLGLRAALVATVGDDPLGRRLVAAVAAAGVDVGGVRSTASRPTTTMVVARSRGAPEFVALRGADRELDPGQLPDEALARARIFHTSCFALAGPPGRDTLLEAVARAAAAGTAISLELNYSPRIGPAEPAEARRLASRLCRRRPLVKASEVDLERLFGAADEAEREEAVARLHGWGAELVCVTRGAAAGHLSWDGGRATAPFEPAPARRVVDSTGAGDAFWAGFLAARLAGREPPACAAAGGRVAALKIAATGPLRRPVTRAELFGTS